MWSLLVTPALAAELLISPAGGPFTGLDGDEWLAWMDWSVECAGQVLDLPAEAAPPVEVQAVRLVLASTDKRWDSHAASLGVGIQLLEPGATPTGLPGVAAWDWTETWFTVAISTEHQTEIPLSNVLPPTWPLTVEDQRIAVWVCPIDPEEGLAWPSDPDADAWSGLVVDPDLSGEDSYLWVLPTLYRLSDLSISGGWAIELVAEDSRTAEETPLSLEAVEPGEAVLGEVAALSLRGGGFAEGMSATIGGLAVAGLAVEDATLATGRSPSGLPVGSHDVRLLSAEGEEALLTTAFTVLLAEEEPGDGGTADGGAADGGADGGGGEDGGAADGGASAGGGGGGCDALGGGGGFGALGGGWLLGLLVALGRRRASRA